MKRAIKSWGSWTDGGDSKEERGAKEKGER